MKKRIAMAMAAVLAVVMLAGCSAPASVEQPEDAPADATVEQSGEGDVTTGDMVFGKVKSIVGNEIELELAEPPFDMEPLPEDGSGGEAGVAMQAVTVTTDAEKGAVTNVTDEDGNAVENNASFAIAGEDGTVQVFGGGENNEMELTYTGESKSVVVPAGATIASMVGTEGTLESIKKGAVLMMTVEDAQAERLTAKDVMIWS